MSNPRKWPTDLDACHRLLAEQAALAEDLRNALQQAAKIHDQVVLDKDQLIQAQRLEIQIYHRFIFGPRRERIIDGQGQQFLFEIDTSEPEPEVEVEPKPEAPARPRPKRVSRQLELDKLPQVRVEHDIPEAEKTCDCCGQPKAQIGQDESRILEFLPARLELQIHVLPKYACPRCKTGVASPEPPTRPIPKALAGAGLLAELITSKFAEHQPLYRFEDASARWGLHLPRSTLCDWVRGVSELLQPLHDLMKQRVLKSPVIWTDDTPVTFLPDAEPGSKTGRFWVYIGDDEHPYDVFDFTENRRRDGPSKFLSGFAGFLQADAFSGYDGLFLDSGGKIVEVACWAHARRKFFEAKSAAPADASLILNMIGRLYEVEDRARPLPIEERFGLRQSDSLAVLNRLREELDRLKARLLPKSAMAGAVGYALNQWEALCRYASDGRLSIDNNVSERRLRDVTIGRKNWLFLGSESAGPRARRFGRCSPGRGATILSPGRTSAR